MKGDEFKARRIAAGWTKRSSVASDIGVQIDSVRKWETDRRSVPLYAIKWLVKTESKKGRN